MRSLAGRQQQRGIRVENNVVKCLHFNENALNSELKRMWRRILRQQVKVDIKRATSRKSSNLQLQNSTKLEKRIKKRQRLQRSANTVDTLVLEGEDT